MSAGWLASMTSIAPASKLLVIEMLMVMSLMPCPGNAFMSLRDPAAKHISRIVRCLGIEPVAFAVEALERPRFVYPVLHRITRHQTARALRVKADDLVAP